MGQKCKISFHVFGCISYKIQKCMLTIAKSYQLYNLMYRLLEGLCNNNNNNNNETIKADFKVVVSPLI